MTAKADANQTDDRAQSIHWTEGQMSKRDLYFIIRDGAKIAECWSDRTADSIVAGLRASPADASLLRAALEQARPYVTECTGFAPHHHKHVELLTRIDAALASEPVAGTVRDAASKLVHKLREKDRDHLAYRLPHEYAVDAVLALSAPAPAGREGIDRLLRLADNIVAHGRSITYPSQLAAQEVRNVVREMVTALRATVSPQAGSTTASAPDDEYGEYSPALKSRDDFLASKGLWSEYVESLPKWEKAQASHVDRPTPLNVMQRARDALYNIARTKGYRLNGVELTEAVRAVARALATPPALGAADRAAVIEECAQAAMNAIPMLPMGHGDASEVCDAVQDEIVAAIRSLAPANTGETGK